MLEPNIVEINKTLKNAADTHLLRRYRGDRSKKDKREKPWMNMEVRNQIKVRKDLNRRHRNSDNAHEREHLWDQYLNQKRKVRELINRQLQIHEEGVAEEIKKRVKS